MRSCRSEPGLPGTWRANLRYAPRPNGVACAWGCAFSAEPLPSPRRSAVCGAYTCASWQSHGRWGCHSPCPSTDAGARPSLVRGAPRRWLRWSAPTTSYRGCWLHRWRRPTARPARRRSRCVWCRFFRGRWGCGQLGPPKTRLGHGTIGTLPIPVHAVALFAFGNQRGHDLGHDAGFVPALEPLMHRALGTKAFGQLIPLTARSHPEDNAVERQPPVREPAPRGFPRPKLLEDRTNAIPQVISDFPNGAKLLACLAFLAFPGHP